MFNPNTAQTQQEESPIEGRLPNALPEPQEKISQQEMQRLTDASDQFSAKIAAELLKGGKSTLVYGLGVNQILCAIAAGAQGETQKQILTAMGLKKDDSLRAVFDAYKKDKTIDYSAVAAAWISKDLPITKEFQEYVERSMGVPFGQLDFSKPDTVSAAVKAINQFFATKTGGAVKDVLSENDLRGAKLVLAAAEQLKGFWTAPFAKEMTKTTDFNVGNGNTVKVPMMTGLMGDAYPIVLEGHQGVVMPTQDGLSMYAIKCADAKDAQALLEGLGSKGFSNITVPKGATRGVVIQMPKFTLETEVSMPEVMKQLGISDVFSQQKADLSKITGKPDLFISLFKQKNILEVNEWGFKGGSATGAVGLPRGGQSISFDSPFIFFIQGTSQERNAIIAIGAVIDPSKGK